MNIQHEAVALYAPRQNVLVERFNRVLKEKYDEAAKFKWNIVETIKRVLYNCGAIPHTTTNVSPFEAMFKRKMRNELTGLRPEGGEKEGVKNIGPAHYARPQEKQKDYFDKRFGTRKRKIYPGSCVTIKRPDGRFSKPIKVVEVGKISLTLENKQKWPIGRLHYIKPNKKF